MQDPLDLVHWPGICSPSAASGLGLLGGAGYSPVAAASYSGPGIELDLKSECEALTLTGRPDTVHASTPFPVPLPPETGTTERRGRRARPAALSNGLSGGAQWKEQRSEDAPLAVWSPLPGSTDTLTPTAHTSNSQVSGFAAPPSTAGQNREDERVGNGFGIANGTSSTTTTTSIVAIDAAAPETSARQRPSASVRDGAQHWARKQSGTGAGAMSCAQEAFVEHPRTNFVVREDLDEQIDELATAFQKMGCNFFDRVRVRDGRCLTCCHCSTS